MARLPAPACRVVEEVEHLVSGRPQTEPVASREEEESLVGRGAGKEPLAFAARVSMRLSQLDGAGGSGLQLVQTCL